MTTVKVTHDHICKGVRGRLSACPVALALNDTPGYTLYGRALVPGISAQAVADTGEIMAMDSLPEEVTDWINRFDASGYVEPMEFEFTSVCKGYYVP